MKIKIVSSYLLVLSIGLVAGTGYGFKQGMENFYALESVLVGYMSTGQASRLHNPTNENIDLVQDYFDFLIDNGLASYIRYEEQGNHILSNIFLKEHLGYINKSLTGMSDYRKSHPMKNLQDVFDNPEDKEEYLVLFEKQSALINSYSNSPGS